MDALLNWLVDLPRNVAGLGSWLTEDFQIGSMHFTPLVLFGAGFGAILSVVLVLKIKSLVFA